MKIRNINSSREVVILGLEHDKYLIYPDVSGMASWSNKIDYEELHEEPDYLVYDEQIVGRKVVEIYKRQHDIDFYSGKLKENESLSPQYFEQKRLRIALEKLELEHNYADTEYPFETDFYFGMLIGKLELINEIIDIQILKEESHSRFAWYKGNIESEYGDEITNTELEIGIIDLCRFLSKKLVFDDNQEYLFTDIYSLWKTFLLGENWSIYGKIDLENEYKPEFNCNLITDQKGYHVCYEFNNW